jgi:hypothetical protein
MSSSFAWLKGNFFSTFHLHASMLQATGKSVAFFFSCSAQNDLHFKELEIIDIQNYEAHFVYFNFSVDQPCKKLQFHF